MNASIKTKLQSVLGVACLVASVSAAGSALVFAPDGGVDSQGVFLHGVDEDIQNDFNDLLNSVDDIDNYSEVHITNATDALAVVIQESPGSSAGNKAKIIQSGSSNTAFIGQKGAANTAYIIQEGDNNAAAIGQVGRNGQALVAQKGDNNLAVIGQANIFNPSSKLSINQENDNNIAFVAGSGGANLGVSQNGGDNILINASSAMRIYIDQSN
ncbi:curlin subunit CsgB [Vibrio mediterranei]